MCYRKPHAFSYSLSVSYILIPAQSKHVYSSVCPSVVNSAARTPVLLPASHIVLHHTNAVHLFLCLHRPPLSQHQGPCPASVEHSHTRKHSPDHSSYSVTRMPAVPRHLLARQAPQTPTAASCHPHATLLPPGNPTHPDPTHQAAAQRSATHHPQLLISRPLSSTNQSCTESLMGMPRPRQVAWTARTCAVSFPQVESIVGARA